MKLFLSNILFWLFDLFGKIIMLPLYLFGVLVFTVFLFFMIPSSIYYMLFSLIGYIPGVGDVWVKPTSLAFGGLTYLVFLYLYPSLFKKKSK